MKHLFYIFAIVGMQLVLTRLHGQSSTLTVYDDLKEDFTLVVNGDRMNNAPSQHVKVTGLQPSRYTVQALFVNPSLPKQIVSIDVQEGREISYALVRNAGSAVMEFRFVGEFAISPMPIAPSAITVVPFQGRMEDPEPIPDRPDLQPKPKVLQTAPVPSPSQNPLPGYNGPIGCSNPMDQTQFEQAKSSVASKTFSDTKMQVAMQITRGNCLLSTQVAQLMALFSFESQKLEFAKFAYDYTYDKGNYYLVNDKFGFESSIRELEQSLKGK